jgi:hypothetical protein
MSERTTSALRTNKLAGRCHQRRCSAPCLEWLQSSSAARHAGRMRVRLGSCEAGLLAPRTLGRSAGEPQDSQAPSVHQRHAARLRTCKLGGSTLLRSIRCGAPNSRRPRLRCHGYAFCFGQEHSTVACWPPHVPDCVLLPCPGIQLLGVGTTKALQSLVGCNASLQMAAPRPHAWKQFCSPGGCSNSPSAQLRELMSACPC